MEDIVKQALQRILKETDKKTTITPITPLKQLVAVAAYDGNGYSKDYIRDFNERSYIEIEKMYAMDKNNKKT